LRFIFVKETYPVHQPAEERIKFRDIVSAMNNKYIWILGGLSFTMQVITGLNAAIYYFKWIVGNVSLMGLFSMLSIVLLVVMLFFPKLVKRFSVPFVITLGAIAAILGCVILFFAGKNLVLIMVGGVLTGLGMIAPPYLLPVMLFEIAKWNLWRGQRSMEATMAAINNFCSNVGQGFAGFLLGALLTAGGYIASEQATSQPDSALFMIRLLMSLIPAAMYVLMIGLAHLFDLKKKYPTIEADLAARGVQGNATQADPERDPEPAAQA
jgi:Na+/melibiose symporter-like transporter